MLKKVKVKVKDIVVVVFIVFVFIWIFSGWSEIGNFLAIITVAEN